MTDQEAPDPQFNANTARLLRREAVRRATKEMSTMTGPGLEDALARISAEVTADAVYRQGLGDDAPSPDAARKPRGQG